MPVLVSRTRTTMRESTGYIVLPSHSECLVQKIHKNLFLFAYVIFFV